ncbi:hypothetical protein ACTIVE_1666 [Actinomadura verrucosospora]|uniref:Uncharacterized protein n=1 Tax=Actinomadura verrucosospora TaxID=46165 RepID=A0A7D3VQQ9_ACTVE|nr:hypothetical protein ACTIVE_1666 [Actinomadura verrucosospora]
MRARPSTTAACPVRIQGNAKGPSGCGFWIASRPSAHTSGGPSDDEWCGPGKRHQNRATGGDGEPERHERTATRRVGARARSKPGSARRQDCAGLRACAELLFKVSFPGAPAASVGHRDRPDSDEVRRAAAVIAWESRGGVWRARWSQGHVTMVSLAGGGTARLAVLDLGTGSRRRPVSRLSNARVADALGDAPETGPAGAHLRARPFSPLGPVR